MVDQDGLQSHEQAKLVPAMRYVPGETLPVLQQYCVVSFERVWKGGIKILSQKQMQVLAEVLVMSLLILTLILSSVKAKEYDSYWLQSSLGQICYGLPYSQLQYEN